MNLTLLLSVLLMVSLSHTEQQLSDNYKKKTDPVGKENHPRSLKEEDVKKHILLSEDDVKGNASSGCSYPFQVVGGNCYFFSNESKNFYESITYCETLSYGHSFDSTIAMLGYDEAENEAVLGEAVKQGKNYWLGGKTEDTVYWKWMDGRDLNVHEPIWHYLEPNNAQNKCAIAQVTASGNMVRSYLYDYDCNEEINFICQTIFNFDFRKIGNYWYLFSEEVGLPHASWDNARDYCRSLSVPIGYHSDLAVLGMPNQDSYNLMDIIAAAYDSTRTWIGAFAPTDCNYQWIDGRSFPLSSHYWKDDQPTCGSNNRAYLFNWETNITYLADENQESKPFICQMFIN